MVVGVLGVALMCIWHVGNVSDDDQLSAKSMQTSLGFLLQAALVPPMHGHESYHTMQQVHAGLRAHCH